MAVRHARPRGRLVAWAVAAALTTMTPAPARAGDDPAPAPRAETRLRGSFSGAAYGAHANAATGAAAARLGRAAFVPCPCRGTDGRRITNFVDSLDGGIVRADAVFGSARGEKGDASATARTTSRVVGLWAFDGLVTADVVRAVATTRAAPGVVRSHGRRSSFDGLVVAGTPVSDDVAPNTRVDVPGVGHVVLNEVVGRGDGVTSRRVAVTMIVLRVTEDNAMGLPVGSVVKIAHASSGFSTQTTRGHAGGSAYAADNATHVSDGSNRVGKAAAVYVGCNAGNGDTRTNTIEEVDVGGVLSLASGTTTARGARDGRRSSARTSATAEDVELLDGLVTADLVAAVADAGAAPDLLAASTAGSGIGGLVVAGVAVPPDVAPGTTLALPGVGRLVVFERDVARTTRAVRVRVTMLRVLVDEPNAHGLPVGSDVAVGVAAARARVPR